MNSNSGGISSVPLMRVRRANWFRNRKQTDTVMTLDTTRTHTREKVTCRSLVSMEVPGRRPRTRNAPSRMAVVTLPGMPNAMVGMSAPPRVELLAAPGPTTPSMTPVPTRSCLPEDCMAWAYATHWDTGPPMPGMMPM